jgi:hypothetical protein
MMKLCKECGEEIKDEKGIELDSDLCFWCSDRSDNADQYYESSREEAQDG